MAHTNEAAIDIDWHPLSDEEIRHFDDTGYLIVRNVLDSDTLEELIEVSDRLMASDRLENRQHNSNNRYDSFRNCISIDDAFIPLIAQETILPIVVQLLGASPATDDLTSDIQTPRSTGHARHRPYAGVASRLRHGNENTRQHITPHSTKMRLLLHRSERTQFRRNARRSR